MTQIKARATIQFDTHPHLYGNGLTKKNLLMKKISMTYQNITNEFTSL